jgi:ribonuclease VapC
MVIDTSAILAILLGEPEAEAFARAIASHPKRLVSALSALEAAIVIHSRKGPWGTRELDLLIRILNQSYHLGGRAPSRDELHER